MVIYGNAWVIFLKIGCMIPVCNIIVCEDIAVNSENKMYIINPFTGMSARFIRKFYTYTVIQGIPNGMTAFKIQIIGPDEKLVKQTEESQVMVEENIIRAKTQWSNICFDDHGEHAVRVLIRCNNDYDVIGTSHIYIQ